MDALCRSPFSGHGVILSKHQQPWQNSEKVVVYFGKQKALARRRERAFVNKGITGGRRDALTGGGLVRSAGGWQALRALRKAKAHLKSDERLLGDRDFVSSVLRQNQEALERQ